MSALTTVEAEALLYFMPEGHCSACNGTQFLRHSPFHGAEPICRPCFMVWYDYGATEPAKVGEISMRLKAERKFPWTGEYAPTSSQDQGEKKASGTLNTNGESNG